MDKSIARVLKIKNELEHSEIKIEDCSDYSEALRGYYVVLDAKNVADVKSFLLRDYKTFEEEVSKGFEDFNENGVTSGILKVLEIYKNGGSYTEAILEENGGIEAILGDNMKLGLYVEDSSNESIDNFVNNSINELVNEIDNNNNSLEEDEEEMYKEMYEELKAKYEAEMAEKDKKIEELNSELVKVEPLKEVLDSVDKLEYEDIDMVVDILQGMEDEERSDLVFGLIETNAKEIIDDPSYDVEKLPVLTILMNQIAACLDSGEE